MESSVSNQKTSSPIRSLPNELKLDIFSRLRKQYPKHQSVLKPGSAPQTDLINVLLTCKDWYVVGSKALYGPGVHSMNVSGLFSGLDTAPSTSGGVSKRFQLGLCRQLGIINPVICSKNSDTSKLFLQTYNDRPVRRYLQEWATLAEQLAKLSDTDQLFERGTTLVAYNTVYGGHIWEIQGHESLMGTLQGPLPNAVAQRSQAGNTDFISESFISSDRAKSVPEVNDKGKGNVAEITREELVAAKRLLPQLFKHFPDGTSFCNRSEFGLLTPDRSELQNVNPSIIYRFHQDAQGPPARSLSFIPKCHNILEGVIIRGDVQDSKNMSCLTFMRKWLEGFIETEGNPIAFDPKTSICLSGDIQLLVSAETCDIDDYSTAKQDEARERRRELRAKIDQLVMGLSDGVLSIDWNYDNEECAVCTMRDFKEECTVQEQAPSALSLMGMSDTLNLVGRDRQDVHPDLLSELINAREEGRWVNDDILEISDDEGEE